MQPSGPVAFLTASSVAWYANSDALFLQAFKNIFVRNYQIPIGYHTGGRYHQQCTIGKTWSKTSRRLPLSLPTSFEILIFSHFLTVVYIEIKIGENPRPSKSDDRKPLRKVMSTLFITYSFLTLIISDSTTGASLRSMFKKMEPYILYFMQSAQFLIRTL